MTTRLQTQSQLELTREVPHEQIIKFRSHILMTKTSPEKPRYKVGEDFTCRGRWHRSPSRVGLQSSQVVLAG